GGRRTHIRFPKLFAWVRAQLPRAAGSPGSWRRDRLVRSPTARSSAPDAAPTRAHRLTHTIYRLKRRLVEFTEPPRSQDDARGHGIRSNGRTAGGLVQPRLS